MPGKNTKREYVEDGIYHVYNPGVDKREVFLDERDHLYFESLLKAYVTPDLPIQMSLDHPNYTYWPSKLAPHEVNVLAYCLMPNHYHLLLKQSSVDGVSKFMRRISTAYVSRFNRKYERSGTLFEGSFKSIYVEDFKYLIELSRIYS